METIVILGIGIFVLLGGICLGQELSMENIPIELTAYFSPSPIVGDGGTSILCVEINPKQDISESTVIQIEIIPHNFSVLRIEKEGLQNLGTRYLYLVPKQKRYKGDKFTTTFNVTATCNCKSGTWNTDIEVTAEGYTAKCPILFIVEEPKTSAPCYGTSVLATIICCSVFLRNSRRR